MEPAGNFSDFLFLVFLNTLQQLFWIFGLLLIFGIILNYLSRITRISFLKSAGYKADIRITGWIGVPVHEAGHALFCLIFGHKIHKIKFFTFNPRNRTLGYVRHSYNASSIYQKTGNFFIGVGPILFGAAVLYGILYFLLPQVACGISFVSETGYWSVDAAANIPAIVSGFGEVSLQAISGVFQKENITEPRFWIFLYLSVSVASHMALSLSDIKNAGLGLITIFFIFLAYNAVVSGLEFSGINESFGSWWKYIKPGHFTAPLNRSLVVAGAILTYASLISAINFVLSFLFLSSLNLFKGRGLFNPFWL